MLFLKDDRNLLIFQNPMFYLIRFSFYYRISYIWVVEFVNCWCIGWRKGDVNGDEEVDAEEKKEKEEDYGSVLVFGTRSIGDGSKRAKGKLLGNLIYCGKTLHWDSWK